ncbi:MAG: nucleotide exchange factor GrpE [Candidatus Verstraetearchaeota archaeon]|nr:nucleotide exchange factor GrpE [Candidatus Verstraetearchaeota archaeon]
MTAERSPSSISPGRAESEKEKVSQVECGKTSPGAEPPEEKDLGHLEEEILKYRQQLSALQKELHDSNTRLKYAQADCENIRKRSERQIEEVRLYANASLICDLLEVVDELELALKNARSAEQGAIVQGVEMTLKKMRKVLEKHGVSQIDCLMRPLDPEKHMVVSREEREDLEENTVIEEMRKGYMLRDRVIRPSVVKVSAKPSRSKMTKEES